MKRKRKNFSSGYADNLKMNDDTYKLRRQVMTHIYSARDIIGRDKFKRIDIRITEKMRDHALAVAQMKDCTVWVAYSTVKDYTDTQLRHVVFHEIGHALFGAEHDRSFLMQPTLPHNTTVEKQDKGLKRLI